MSGEYVALWREGQQLASPSRLNICFSGDLIHSCRSDHVGKHPSQSFGWALVPSLPVQSLVSDRQAKAKHPVWRKIRKLCNRVLVACEHSCNS